MNAFIILKYKLVSCVCVCVMEAVAQYFLIQIDPLRCVYNWTCLIYILRSVRDLVGLWFAIVVFVIKFFAYRNDYNRADFGWLDIFDIFHWQISLMHTNTHTHIMYIFAKITYCSFLQSLASPFQSSGFWNSIPHAAALYFIQHHKFRLELVNTILLCRRSFQLNCKSCMGTIKRVSVCMSERKRECRTTDAMLCVFVIK